MGGRTYVYDEIKGCKIDPNQVAKSHLSAFIRLMDVFPLLFHVVFVFLSPVSFFVAKWVFFSRREISKRALFPSGAGFFFDPPDHESRSYSNKHIYMNHES